MAGKNRDWCTKQGCNNRSQGVKIRENACNKLFCLCLFGVAACIYLGIGLSCLFRGMNAVSINNDFSQREGSSINAYDSCTVPLFSTRSREDVRSNFDELIKEFDCDNGNCPEQSTNWTTVWIFNGISMLVQGINLVVLTVGTFFFMPRYIGTICNWVMGCFCNFAWIVFAIRARGSTAGERCADNMSPVIYEGNNQWNL